MSARDEEMFDRVFVVRLGADNSLAATVLSLIRIKRHALDIAALRQRDNHWFFGDQIFLIDPTQFQIVDFGTAFRRVLCFDCQRVFANDSSDIRFVRQQKEMPADIGEQLGMFFVKFFPFEIRERTKLH